VAAISPVATQPAAGTRNQLEEATLDNIDMTWPVEAATGLPDTWAMKNDAIIVVKPTPDQAYVVELTGTFRPNAISAANQTTYISSIYPDLLVAACMVFMAGYQRDYGAAADDPAKAVSWESQYQTLAKSALEEEQRRKGSGVGWLPFSPTEAQPART